MFINKFTEEDYEKIQSLVNKKKKSPNRKTYILIYIISFASYFIFVLIGLLTSKNFSHFFIYILFLLSMNCLDRFVDYSYRKSLKINTSEWVKKDDSSLFFIDESELKNVQKNVKELLIPRNLPIELQKNFINEFLSSKWIGNPNLPKFSYSIDSPDYFILILPILKSKRLFCRQFLIIPIQKNEHNLRLMNQSPEFQFLLKNRIINKFEFTKMD